MSITDAAKRIVESQLEGTEDYPGHDLVRTGLLDIYANRPTIEAGVVLVAADRLRLLGIDVPEAFHRPAKDGLWEALERDHGDEAHARYNALLGRVLSFATTAESLRWKSGAG